MLNKNHNDVSKQLMQKILIYIDTVLVNSGNAVPEDVVKILTGGLLNVRDALFSEIVKDSHIEKMNELIQTEVGKKKSKEENQEVV
tara:strand:+ start:1621 stop:1878 length:258 start_codon:yes stop_codon:yes gene_type:complete